MNKLRDQFREYGFVFLPQEILNQDMVVLEREYSQLAKEAEQKLSDKSLSGGIIAVAEANDPQQLCRFEYLAGTSSYIRNVLVPRFATLIEKLIGEPVSLFKDKCNLKRPGGGAFTPHQDVTAYSHFNTKYQTTVAISLDESDEANGALEIAETWDSKPSGIPTLSTPRGQLAILPSYEGGSRNGDIMDEYASTIHWRLIHTKPGDVILFDSYVPHRSGINRSSSTRRILFFTFNLANEGNFYDLYYTEKRSRPTNPIFHVATPTVHGG